MPAKQKQDCNVLRLTEIQPNIFTALVSSSRAGHAPHSVYVDARHATNFYTNCDCEQAFYRKDHICSHIRLVAGDIWQLKEDRRVQSWKDAMYKIGVMQRDYRWGEVNS